MQADGRKFVRKNGSCYVAPEDASIKTIRTLVAGDHSHGGFPLFLPTSGWGVVLPSQCLSGNYFVTASLITRSKFFFTWNHGR